MLPKDNPLEDEIIKWVAYTKEDKICDRFPLDVWHQIVHDIDSDEEWAIFLSESTAVRCYILKLCCNDKSIAFAYIMQEDIDRTIVSIHGGGWGNTLTHYRGYILMIRYLLDQGLKVRTYCQLSNPSAIRFSRSVGFVPYKYSSEEVFMSINLKRLTSTKIYKRFYSIQSQAGDSLQE